MTDAGRNLPRFTEVQLDFAQHIRNPQLYPCPADIEPRRMQIYVELFYNSIATFVNNTFPVARQLLGETRWGELTRAFIHRHRSTSPYFLDIPQEFLEFVTSDAALPGLPAYFAELIHYEWVELALDVLDEDYPQEGVDPLGDLQAGEPLVSPLAWSLAYRFPVQHIRPDNQPDVAPAEPTHLIVYRDRAERVRFFESNAIIAQLLEVLQVNADPAAAGVTGTAAVTQVVAQLGRADPAAAVTQGLRMLATLRDADIIVGVRSQPTRPAPSAGEI